MKGKGWLVVVFVSLVLLFLNSIDFFTSMFLKFFINNFATGKSEFKVIFFIVYSMVAALFLFAAENGFIFIKRKFFQDKKVLILLFSLLAFLFVVGVSSHIYFVDKYGLEFNNYYKAVYEGKQSSTEFTHIHSAKAVLSIFGNFFNPNSHFIYDEGLFFAVNLPAFIWIVFLVLLPVVFILSLLALRQFYQFVEKWKEQRLFLMWLFLISLMSSLKNTVDGGLFNAETLFWFGVCSCFLAAMYFQWEFDLKIWGKRFLGIMLIVFLVATPLYLFYGRRFSFLWMQFGVYWMFVVFLFLMFWCWTKRERMFMVIVVLGYFFLVLGVDIMYSDTYLDYSFTSLRNMVMEVPTGAQAYLYVLNKDMPVKGCEEYLYRLKEVSICTFQVQEDGSIGELLNTYSTFSMNYFPLLVENVSCNFEVVSQEIGQIVVVEGVVPPEINSSLITATFIYSGETSTGFRVYNYTVQKNDCVPMYSDIIFRTFNEKGIKMFIQQ